METNIKGIYAVGDCIETVSLINHRPTMMQLSSAAYRQGMVAGTNAAGGYDIYEGALGTFVTVIGDLEVAATGFNEFFAEAAGYKIITGKAHGKTKPEYYPGAKDITVKTHLRCKNRKSTWRADSRRWRRGANKCYFNGNKMRDGCLFPEQD